jgi:hypothetical protein
MLGRYVIADGEALALPLTAGVGKAEKRHRLASAHGTDSSEYDRGYQAAFSKGYLRGHSLGVHAGLSDQLPDRSRSGRSFHPRPHPGLSRHTTPEFARGYAEGFPDGLKVGYEEGLTAAAKGEIPGLGL